MTPATLPAGFFMPDGWYIIEEGIAAARPFTHLYYTDPDHFIYLEVLPGGKIRNQCLRRTPWIHFRRNISNEAANR